MDGQFGHIARQQGFVVFQWQLALQTRQHQQLLEGALQAVGALFGIGQRPFGGGALGHSCHLQAGLDYRQRAA